MRLGHILIAIALVSSTILSAQPPDTRQRARIPYRLGWEYMRSEKYPEAAKSFQDSIDIDPTFEYAHYGLGRANLAMKKYVEAITVLERCKNLYTTNAARRFSNVQDAQRYRKDQMMELTEQIRIQNATRPTAASQEQARQMEVVKSNIEQTVQRDNGLTIDISVPPWVTLSLGSAYFRSGRMADAEREYKATIAQDPKSGEALNNLAVVYLETERFAEADSSLKDAKRVGFKVNPQLEQAIRDKLRK